MTIGNTLKIYVRGSEPAFTSQLHTEAIRRMYSDKNLCNKGLCRPPHRPLIHFWLNDSIFYLPSPCHGDWTCLDFPAAYCGQWALLCVWGQKSFSAKNCGVLYCFFSSLFFKSTTDSMTIGITLKISITGFKLPLPPSCTLRQFAQGLVIKNVRKRDCEGQPFLLIDLQFTSCSINLDFT